MIFNLLRKWLERNKIFFETIAAVALTTMSFILSWQANMYTRRQTEILEKQAVPFIQVWVSYKNGINISIVNNGSPLRDLIISMYYIIIIDAAKGGLEKKEFFPMRENLSNECEIVKEDVQAGEIAFIQCNDSSDVITLIKNSVIWSLKQKGIIINNFYSKKYLQIGYRDTLGKSNQSIFEIEMNGEGRLISMEETFRIFGRNNPNSDEIPVILENLSAAIISKVENEPVFASGPSFLDFTCVDWEIKNGQWVCIKHSFNKF